jgi:hypothetical protein
MALDSLNSMPSHEFPKGWMNDLEKLNLKIFELFIPEFYTPSENPYAMSVGASSTREATIIKQFHENKYSIPYERVKVAACNSMPYPDDSPWLDIYDFNNFGFTGDATQEFTWAMPFMDSGSETMDYDLVYIRNPDLINLNEWGIIYYRAIQFVKESGVVVTLIRESDVHKYESVLNYLSGHDIKPVFSDETNIGLENSSEDFHYLLGVFKSK